MQGNQNPRMALPQMTQNRPMMQNPQQQMNPNIQGIQSPLGNQTLINQQPQPQQQQQQNSVPPPPPYPEPPPPYPGQSGQTQVKNSESFIILTIFWCEFS